MRLKLFLGVVLAALFAGAAFPVFAQSVPAAQEANLPLSVGGGISRFNPDWGSDRHLWGITGWADWTPSRVPSILNGIGLEAEVRDLDYGRTSTLPSKLRFTTVGGGVIYSWRHYRRFRPYGKFLESYGSLNFNDAENPAYTHDSRTVKTIGVGVDCKVSRRIWVRADYEYQFWPKLFGPRTLNPEGVTIGASYHFGSLRHSRY